MSPTAGVAPIPTSPTGATAAGFEYRATFEAPDPAGAITSVRIQVRRAGDRQLLWGPKAFARTGAWPAGGARVSEALAPAVPAQTDLEWRVRTRSGTGLLSPWSSWQPFSLPVERPEVTPTFVGPVATLAGKRLHAEVTIPRDAREISRFEVQLAPRSRPDSPAWETPLWSRSGGPLTLDQRLVGMSRSTSRTGGFWFETLDGCRQDGGDLIVGADRPVVRIGSAKRIRSYTWTLHQFGAPVRHGKGEREREGLSDDGLCLVFRLPRLVRRGKVPRGFFFPPFDRVRLTYRGETYGPNVVPDSPDGHSGFAVDFNQGSNDDDAGHPVLAAAGGRVTMVRAFDGTVQIRHWGGAYMTEYTHMKEIRVRPFSEDPERGTVIALQKIGEIGKVGARAPHLHHRHYRRTPSGDFRPIKMRFGREPCFASISGPRGVSRKSVTGYRIRGWDPDLDAVLTVRVHWADGTDSRLRRLRFAVAKSHVAVPPCPDPGCGPSHAMTKIVRRYDGPELAPGDYSVRYRCKDDLGTESTWAYDHTISIVTP
jgi:hypothetical protein